MNSLQVSRLHINRYRAADWRHECRRYAARLPTTSLYTRLRYESLGTVALYHAKVIAQRHKPHAASIPYIKITNRMTELLSSSSSFDTSTPTVYEFLFIALKGAFMLCSFYRDMLTRSFTNIRYLSYERGFIYDRAARYTPHYLPVPIS